MEQNSGIELTFDLVESAVMKSKDNAFIFYLDIANKLPKQVNVKSPLATYITVQGEEIEQDFWLSGLVNGYGGTTIRSGAFKKMGIVIDKQKLRKISSDDRLYVTIELPKLAQRFNFGFVCSDEAEKRFSLYESDQEAVESESPKGASVSAAIEPDVVDQTNSGPAPSKQEITDIIERLELLEEKFGIAISGLYATSYYQSNGTPPYHEVRINFDVTSLSGGAFERSFPIRASAYNAVGQLLDTSSAYIDNEKFIGFSPMSILSHLDQEPTKIRLFPAA